MAVAGLALWFSRGALDVAGTADAPRRVAMLPSWPELVGFLMLAIIAIAVAALLRDRARPAAAGEPAWNPALADAVRPLFALAILAVPYLPWLPDRIPALQELAGPFRWVFWGLVLGQVALVVVLRVVMSDAAWLGTERPAATAIVFLVSLATSVIASAQLTETSFFPAQLLLCLIAAAATAWVCRRSPRATPGTATLRVTLYTIIGTTSIVSTGSLLPGARPQPRFDPEARGRLPMLDEFDATARPLAVLYDPFSVVSPSAVPPLFSLTAVPGQWLAPQPTRVLLNARFVLPAGEYDVELRESAVPETAPQGTVGLQIGREGDPVESWPIVVAGGGRWRQRFRLPLDAEFVAFRADPEVERAVASLRVRPVQVVDRGRRLPTDSIFASVSFGSTWVFFHDAVPYIEPGGFWVRGRARMRVTLAKTDASNSFTMNLHCGARPNRVTIATPHWSERLDLVPNTTRTVVVPPTADESLMPLEITTSSGFVPADIEPANKDQRLLGCWITFAS